MGNLFRPEIIRILHGIIDPAVLIDSKGLIIDTNKLALESLGYSDKELIGMNFHTLICNQSISCEKCEITDGISSYCILGKKNDKFLIEPVNINFENETFILLKLNKQPATPYSPSILEGITSGKSVAVVVTYNNGEIYFADAQFSDLVCDKGSKLEGKNITDIFWSDQAFIQSCLKNEEVLQEKRVLKLECPNRSTRYFQFDMLKLPNEKGKIFWLFNEIDDFNLSTNTLLNKSQEMNENLQNGFKVKNGRIKSTVDLNNIFNLSADLICIADLRGNIIKANPAFYHVLGLTLSESKSKNIKEIVSGYSKEYISSSVLPGSIENENNIVVRYESCFIRDNKKEIWLSWTLQTLSEENIIFAVARDITKIKQAEREYIAAKEKAEEGDRLKSAFLANMSHEVRTPMNAIIGFSFLLDNDDLERDKRSKYIQIIKGRCNDLLRIIDDILDISRIEAGQLDISPEPFYVSDFFAELLEMHYFKLKSAEKTHLRLNHIPLIKNYQLYNDRQRLLQVMNNLLDNAIKFTSEGSIIFGCKEYHDNEFLFFVEDTGVGIPKEKIGIIFHRFRQAEENLTRKFGGNGLGLAISKPLINLMGGKMWVESEVGRGSKFYFTVEKVLGKEDKKESNKFEKRTILVVEDDRHSMGYLRIVLEQLGVSLKTAKTGYEALELIKQGLSIDVILLDIQLPDMSGLDVARNIRNMNLTIPIVAQTAYAQQTDRAACINAGCNDYISKPVDDEKLVQLISKYF